MRDVSNRAINDRRAINHLYGTISSHDEVYGNFIEVYNRLLNSYSVLGPSSLVGI